MRAELTKPTLPACSTPTVYNEDGFDATHIYPSRVGTVSEVITVDAEQNFYDFKDNTIPADLNFSDCRIPSEKATVIFQTGVMAGKEFDIEQTGDALTVFNDFDFTTEELSCMKARFDHIDRNGMFTVETMDTYNKILEAYDDIDPEVRIKGMPHLQSAVPAAYFSPLTV